MRTRLVAMCALLAVAWPCPLRAQWGANGVVVAAPPAAPLFPKICSDGAGGAYIGWMDDRDYLTHEGDIYAQRVTAGGQIAPGWPADGVPVCRVPGSQFVARVAPDATGGVFVVWHDARNAQTLGTRHDLYFQRLTSTGSRAPAWLENGNPVLIAADDQNTPGLVADGVGGALIAWEDTRSSLSDVYALHFGGTGALSPGWPTEGLRLTPLAGFQGTPTVVPDGTDGFIVSWTDRRAGASGAYAQRLTPTGTIVWAPDGIPAHVNPTFYQRDMVSDGDGGLYIGSGNLPPLPWIGGNGSLILHRMTGGGTLAPGWPAAGVLICQAPEVRQGFAMAPDGLGGALMVWSDYRNYFTEDTGSDIYALRVLADGSRAPGWPENGVRVTASYPFDEDASVVGDGQGGAYISFRVYASDADYVFVQHLTATGEVAPGWPAGGRSVMDQPGGYERDPVMTTDGAGGCIVAWSGDGIRARRFMADGPVATLISLTSAVAEDGIVRLAWHGSDAAHLPATVERRIESGSWQVIANIAADASGRFAHEDRLVEPGARYAYRLRWREPDGEHTTNESWVSVPPRLALALEGLRPNPAARDLNVWFTLPSRATGRIELLDVAGRVRSSVELSGHRAGRQAVSLGHAGEFEPGVYWIRLVHGDEQRHTRGVLIR